MPRSKSQPLSAQSYAVISLLGLLAAVGAFVYFNSRVGDLHRNDQLFYLILLLAGIGIGSFFFGAMRSYAAYAGKDLPGSLDLGGPIIAAILVVYGGFKLVPPAETQFSIKVRLHNANGALAALSGSEVGIQNSDLRYQTILVPDMEATFILPAKFRGKTVQFGLRSPGYELMSPDSSYLVTDEVALVLPVHRDRTLAEIRGNILDQENHPLDSVTVQLTAGTQAYTTGANGLFILSIPPELQQDSVKLFCVRRGYEPKLIDVYPASKQPPIIKMYRTAK